MPLDPTRPLTVGRRVSSLRRRARQAAAPVVILGCFYTFPVATDVELPARSLLSVPLLVVLAAVVVAELRRHGDRVGRLVQVFIGVVALLALSCYAVATHHPGQFEGLVTRTDALYFTVTTITTVGYGDIHASGQAARALVTAMMVFDVVFLGALGSTIWDRFRAERTPQPADRKDTP